MRHALVTGGSGFVGGLLIERLLGEGWSVVSIDLEPPVITHPNLFSKQGDIRQHDHLRDLLDRHRYDVIFHVAAALGHERVGHKQLWTTNVDGTRIVADFARYHGVPNLVYVSTNCLWGESLSHPIREDEPPNPVDDYGRSKWEAEKLLKDFAGDMNVVILRCPTVVDEGRLGLLALLFEFVQEDRKVWVVGDGSNCYQFIYGQDLIDAMLRAADYPQSATFGVGSEDVPTLADTYRYLIENSRSRSQLRHLPKRLALLAMRIAHWLRVSPLGPYHYRMIAGDFRFDTEAAKQRLGWQPTLSNNEMLLRAYGYYAQNREQIEARLHVSAHRRPAKMGVIKLLKWFS